MELRARRCLLFGVVAAVIVTSLVTVPASALPLQPPPGVISSGAGTGAAGFFGDGGLATAAELSAPIGADFDADGNLYIADAGNSRIRRVDATTGVIVTVAGNGTFSFSGNGGPATSAGLNSPFGVVSDIDGDLYISDSLNHTVRRVDARTGIVTAYAGLGGGAFGGDGGLAVSARLSTPFGIDVDAAGNLYIADSNNHRIRRVDVATGIISTVVGTGVRGSSGDGGRATAATIDTPMGVRIAPNGDIVLADRGGRRIRRVDIATGIISTVAGTGALGFSGDGGPAVAATMDEPFHLDLDAAGNIYFGDRANHRVRRIDARTGLIGTVAGTGVRGQSGNEGPAIEADLDFPYGPAVAPDGLLAITHNVDHRIRTVTPATAPNAPSGVTTVAGDGSVTVSWATTQTANVARVTVVPGGTTVLVPFRDGSVTIAGLTNGTPHVARVEAFNGWAYGAATESASFVPVGVRSIEVRPTFVRDVSGHSLAPDFTLTARTSCNGTDGETQTLTEADVAAGASGLLLDLPAGSACRLLIDELRGRAGADVATIEGFAPVVAAEPGWVGSVAVAGVDVIGNDSDPFRESSPVPLALDVALDETTIDTGIVDVEVRLTTRSTEIHAWWDDDIAPVDDIGAAVASATVSCATWDPVQRRFDQDIEWTLDGHRDERRDAIEAGTWPDICTVTVESFTPDPSHGRGFLAVEVNLHGEVEHLFSAASLPQTFAFVKRQTSAGDVVGDNSVRLLAVHEAPSEPALFDQFDATATGTAPVNAFLLSLLANASYEDSWDADFSAHTDPEWRMLVAEQAEAWGLDGLTFDVSDLSTGTQSFAVRTNDALLVSFRGTELSEPADVLTDAGTARELVPTPYGPVGVHTGFWRALDSVYPELLALAQEQPDQPVWLTGHSLGGAVATLAAMRLTLDGVTVGGVHTFGAPALGDQALADVHDTDLGLRAKTQRWVNDHDIIPMALDVVPGYVDLGVTNVFTRTGPVDRTDFDFDPDALVEPLTAPGLDDHDIGLYAARVWELLDRTLPAVAAGLPEPEPPFLRPPGADSQRAIDLLISSFSTHVDILIAGLRDEVGLVADEAAAALLAADASIALVVAVLTTGYAQTLQEVIDTLTRIGATAEQIAAAIAILAGDLLAMLRDGLAVLDGELAVWATLFDSGPIGFLDGELAGRFDLETQLGALGIPTIDPNDVATQAVDAALDALELSGWSVDWVEAGVGGRPAPDIVGERLQIRRVFLLDDLGEAPGARDPIRALSALLPGLADTLALDATGILLADATITVVVGVGEEGFYISDESGVDLAIAGAIDVTGTAQTLGAPTTVSGSLGVDLRASAPAPGSTPAHSPGTPMPAQVTGQLDALLEITHPQMGLTWDGSWTVSGPPATADLVTSTVVAMVDVPGLDTAIRATGTLRPDGRWDLAGQLDEPALLNGLIVTSAEVALTAGPASLHGTATVGLALDLGVGADSIVPLTLVVHFDDQGATGTATAHLADDLIGAVHFTDSSLTVSVATNPASVSATLSGGALSIFPGSLDGGLQLFDYTASIGANGVIATTGDVRASFGGVLDIEADGVEVMLGRDATGPLVSFGGAVIGTIPALDGLSVSVTGAEIARDGTATFSEILITSGATERVLNLGGLIPIVVPEGGLTLRLLKPGDLDSFVVTVTGEVDLSGYAGAPFTPIVRIGSQEISEGSSGVSFTIAVESLSEGRVLPLDVGPVTFGFADLRVGSATVGASITLGGLIDGQFSSVIGGTVTVTGAGDLLGNGVDIALAGHATTTAAGTRVDIHAAATLDGALDDLIEVVALQLAVDLGFMLNVDGSIDFEPPVLDNVSYERLSVQFGDFADLVSNDGTIDLTPSIGSPLVTFGGTSVNPGLGITFGESFAALAGFSGGAGNLVIELREDDAGAPIVVPVLLDDFYADVAGPEEGTRFGLPEWFPFVVERAGITFPSVDLDNPPPGGLALDPSVLEGMRIRFSGGLQSNESWPITATVQDLEVDVARLVDPSLGFPIVSVGGGGGGVEPFDIGPVTIGGALGLGTVEIDVDPGEGVTPERVLYARIDGEFAYSGMGAGVDLVISQYGPVLAKVIAPMAVPLGTSGIMLAGVHGGITFGGPGFEPPDDPAELLRDPSYDLDFPMNPTTIAMAVESCAQENVGLTPAQIVRSGCLTWNDGGTLFVGATLTSYVAPGVISGDVTLAANLALDPIGLPKLRFAGHGVLDMFGVPVGEAGFLLSLDDPLGPVLDVASLAPGGPGSPLAFVMPATSSITMRLDTEGIALGSALATRAFVERLTSGSIAVGQEIMDDSLDALAADLDADRTSLLSQRILDTNGDRELSSAESARSITRSFLIERLLGTSRTPALLPTSPPTDAAGLATLGEDIALIQREFLTRLQARVAVAATGLDLISLADPVYLATAANALVTNDEARALAAYSAVLQDVLLEAFAEAGSAFNSVFDPSFEVRGGLQPVLLGVPFGEPTEEAVLRIDRDGVTLGMKGSLSKMFLSIGGGVGVAAGELVTRIGLADTFEMTGQLPLTAVVDGLLTGGPLAIDPFDLDWSVELVSATTVAGFEVATMTGVLLPPNNQSYLDARVWKAWQPGGPSSSDSTPVNTQAHYDSLLAHGGLLLTTQLRAPELLTDPAAVFERASVTPPDDVLGYVPWLQDNISALTELTEVGSYQVYFPSVLELLPRAAAGRVWQAPSDALEIIDDAYGEAFWDVEVLGLDIGRGLMSIEGVDPPEVELSADVELIGRRIDLQLGGSTIVPASGPGVALPALGFDVQLTSTNVTEFLGEVGVPVDLRAPGTGARLRGYSPGFDLAGDELQVRGGVEASMTLQALPVLPAAEFEMRVMPSGGSRIDVIGTATVPTMNLAPGIVVDNASVTLEVIDGVASFRIAGAVTTPLGAATVDATLAPDFTGPIAVTMNGPPQAAGGFTITAGLVVTLARDSGGALSGAVAAGGTVMFPAWLRTGDGASSATFTGTVSADAFDLALQVSGLQIYGQTLTSTTARLRRVGATVTVEAAGETTVIGTSVSVSGTITVAGDGVTTDPIGELAMSATSLGLGSGWQSSGEFALVVGNGELGLAVDAAASVPGLGSFDVEGTIDRANGQWIGELDVAFGSSRRIGGATSQLAVTGTFVLARVAPTTRGGSVTTTFSASAGKVEWVGAVLFPEASIAIASDGSVDASIAAYSFSAGSTFTIGLPSASFSAGPGGANPQLVVGSASLSMTGTGLGGTVTVPGFTVGATGGPVGSEQGRSVAFGSLTMTAPMRLDRVGNAWRLSLGGRPQLSIPGIDQKIEFQEFWISSNGSMSVQAVSQRLGPNVFHLRNASILLSRSAGPTAATSVRLASIAPGSLPLQLQLPVGEPISLSQYAPLTIASDGTLTQALTRTLTLGPGVSVPTVPFSFTIDDDGMALTQTDEASFSLLGATVTMEQFAARSDGSLAGTITGGLAPLGYPIASSTMTLSKPAGWVDARIGVSATADLGPLNMQLVGWTATNGRFDFSKTDDIDVRIPVGLAEYTLEGSLSVRLRNSGLTGSFDGQICRVAAVGSGCGSFDLALTSTGTLVGAIAGIAFTIPLLQPPTQSINLAPSMAPASDVLVSVASTSAGGPVYFPLPAVSDDLTATSSLVTTCTRAPGTTFAVGSTPVTCTVTDGGGLTATRSFRVTVVQNPAVEQPAGTVPVGSAATYATSGFAASSTVTLAFHSDPVDLGTVTADADGAVRGSFLVPNVAPGQHTLVLEGAAPDGSTLITSIAIEVRSSGCVGHGRVDARRWCGPCPGPSPAGRSRPEPGTRPGCPHRHGPRCVEHSARITADRVVRQAAVHRATMPWLNGWLVAAIGRARDC